MAIHPQRENKRANFYILYALIKGRIALSGIIAVQMANYLRQGRNY